MSESVDVVGTPFIQDETIETYTDWIKLTFQFFTDAEGTTEVNFSGSTFIGEILDKPGGTKLFDLTFNTPTTDGKISPSLSDTNSATLTGRKVHYFVKVQNPAGFIEPYWSGTLTVSNDFKPGA